MLYQNQLASSGLQGYFHENPQILDYLDGLNEKNRRIWQTKEEGELVDPDDTEILLDINRELRRLYDQAASKYLESFDETNKPILGWDEYYKREN